MIPAARVLFCHSPAPVQNSRKQPRGRASGRVVYTGATRELGTDLDTFEERLVELLTQEDGRA